MSSYVDKQKKQRKKLNALQKERLEDIMDKRA